MAEGARLESVYTATYRGFESLPHRHQIQRKPVEHQRVFFVSEAYQTTRFLGQLSQGFVLPPLINYVMSVA